MGINSNTENSTKEKTFLLWEWSNIGAGSSERFRSLYPWKYSKLEWTWPWATCLDWPCFQQQGWIRWCLEVPANLHDSVNLWTSYPYPCSPDPNIHSDLAFMKYPTVRINCLRAVQPSTLCPSPAKTYPCMMEMLRHCEGIC